MSRVVLECQNIKKTYKKKKKKLVVLKEVNYKFASGKVYAIVGKSGAGKTTLINMLGLLKKPDSGKIFILESDTSKLSENQTAELRNTKIGFIFQSFYLDPLMTAEENIKLPMYLNTKRKKEEINSRVKELLQEMELEDRENHFPKELSGGEQQRVAIARALANNPEIILADEPTGSLDPENEENVLNILKKLAKQGKCVIIVTHSKTVREYADVILEIKKTALEEVPHDTVSNK